MVEQVEGDDAIFRVAVSQARCLRLILALSIDLDVHFLILTEVY